MDQSHSKYVPPHRRNQPNPAESAQGMAWSAAGDNIIAGGRSSIPSETQRTIPKHLRPCLLLHPTLPTKIKLVTQCDGQGGLHVDVWPGFLHVSLLRVSCSPEKYETVVRRIVSIIDQAWNTFRFDGDNMAEGFLFSVTQSNPSVRQVDKYFVLDIQPASPASMALSQLVQQVVSDISSQVHDAEVTNDFSTPHITIAKYDDKVIYPGGGMSCLIDAATSLSFSAVQLAVGGQDFYERDGDGDITRGFFASWMPQKFVYESPEAVLQQAEGNAVMYRLRTDALSAKCMRPEKPLEGPKARELDSELLQVACSALGTRTGAPNR